MPIQQNHSSKGKFPLRWFAAAFVISLSTTVFSEWQTWQIHNRSEEQSDKRAHVTEDFSRIMLFEEAQTMSAHMAAVMGDLSYEKKMTSLMRN